MPNGWYPVPGFDVAVIHRTEQLGERARALAAADPMQGTAASQRPRARAWMFALQCVALVGCAHVSALRQPDRNAATELAVRLELPPALEQSRAAYVSDIDRARTRVISWFAANGLSIDGRDLVDSAVVFADVPEAKHYLSTHFGVPEEKIPDGFSGTVEGKTLLLVAREPYSKTWARLYPDHPWSNDFYQALITHELAHRAHAAKSQALFGSEDGMGPRWFFEGLAITCASQFADRSPSALTRDALQELITKDAGQVLSYPLYGQMFRSIATSFPLKWLVEHGGRGDFSAEIQREYLPSEFVLEESTASRSRGTILLVHGSAPFNVDGRIPVAGLDSPYARTDFYKDLAVKLRASGWAVLRYSKPGVSKTGVDATAYARTDLALLTQQLRNLWRFLPADRPRVVFAWSEGSLHVRALAMAELDAVILLGGISTNIGDVVRAQGGPPPEALKAELAGKDRREMLGVDHPVGRVLDELALDDNWKAFLPFERLPLLVLQGAEDAEVPRAQAAKWKQHLKDHRITVVEGQGFGHRFMPQAGYDLEPLVLEITHWLDGTFPRRIH